ncbi:MAG: hypothetical protein WB789_05685 [Thermoplasmata archaeon]
MFTIFTLLAGLRCLALSFISPYDTTATIAGWHVLWTYASLFLGPSLGILIPSLVARTF